MRGIALKGITVDNGIDVLEKYFWRADKLKPQDLDPW